MYIKFSEELKLNISEEFLNRFNQSEQFPGQVEAGGILLGKYDLQSHTYYISGITTPNKNDRAGFSFFIRSKKSAQKEINKAWKKSNGIVNYLGEWHTHCCIRVLPHYSPPNHITGGDVQNVSNRNESTTGFLATDSQYILGLA